MSQNQNKKKACKHLKAAIFLTVGFTKESNNEHTFFVAVSSVKEKSKMKVTVVVQQNEKCFVFKVVIYFKHMNHLLLIAGIACW